MEAKWASKMTLEISTMSPSLKLNDPHLMGSIGVIRLPLVEGNAVFRIISTI